MKKIAIIKKIIICSLTLKLLIYFPSSKFIANATKYTNCKIIKEKLNQHCCTVQLKKGRRSKKCLISKVLTLIFNETQLALKRKRKNVSMYTLVEVCVHTWNNKKKVISSLFEFLKSIFCVNILFIA